MSSSEPGDLSPSWSITARASRGLLAGLGVALAGGLLFDAYADWVLQGNPLWSTALENLVPTVLAASLPYVGWRLSRGIFGPVYLRETAKWALIACVGTFVLSGLAVGIQVFQDEIKPVILVLQVATVGAVGGLWVGYNLARVKRSEQAAQEDRDRLANLLEGLPAPVVHGRFDGDKLTVLKTNEAFREVFGLSVDKIVGENLYDLVVPEEKREEVAEIDRQAIDEGLVDREVQRLTNQGLRDFQLRIAQALDRGESETYAIYTDITERKKRQRHLETLFEQSPDMINVHDGDGNILQANPRFFQKTGYDRDDLSDLNVWKLDDKISPEEARELWNGMEVGGRRQLEGRYRRKDGSTFPVEVHIRRLSLEGEDQFVAITRDITEREEREARLRTVNTRLQLALESSNTGTFDWDIETDEVIWDEISERLFGYAPGDFPGRFEGWADRVHPDDLPKAEREIRRAIEHKKVYDVVFRVQSPGEKQRWVRACGSVEYDEEGNPIRMIGIHTDETDRKRREQKLREAKEEAEEASRLKTAMLANMSHELRTPLTSITGFSEILEARQEGEFAMFARKIREGSQRLHRTLESVLNLSKLEAGVRRLDTEELALGDVIEEVVETLRDHADEKSPTVVTDLPSSPAVGHWNEDALFRIGRNLLENAIKFTPEEGRVAVRVGTAGEEAVLEVDDTGIGMNPEQTDELFEAFRQESEGKNREYEGSGLGLSIVKRLTEELGGSIEVETEKGVGTCFTVRLPLADDTEGSPEEPAEE